jgi:hypothetical protein
MYERYKITYKNNTDKDGNPAGGFALGVGFNIEWQPGPLGDPPAEPTGAFVEDVLEAVKQRIEFYQTNNGGAFACRENAIAITKLEESLQWLKHRTMNRVARGVQGLNKK